ncbi:DUF1684 domain-containing protein [Deinococcus sonorensis]|uniref:DUF1684 domain-containing protein n=2 Tax=Deinococcus sonorensis TaxID=309891 RepID=A0AAU7U7C2_9DEIO
MVPDAAPAPPLADLTLLDWRRRLADLYAEVRAGYATDPAAAHAHWQRVRAELYRQHPQSPLPPERRSSFMDLPVWPYDLAYAFEAPLLGGLPEDAFVVQTSAGHDLPLRRLGRLPLHNDYHDLGTLDAYWIEVYGGGLFIPFRDASAGHTSYGGGRYLLDTVKSADLGSRDRRLILDFNFAYHPSCFHDPRWSCPLAPPQNVLVAEIRAGERL